MADTFTPNAEFNELRKALIASYTSMYFGCSAWEIQNAKESLHRAKAMSDSNIVQAKMQLQECARTPELVEHRIKLRNIAIDCLRDAVQIDAHIAALDTFVFMHCEGDKK